MADEADRSVVLALQQVAFLGKCDDEGLGLRGWPFSFSSEILGKHRQKKNPWVTAEILDLCDKRRELKKKRFESEGSEKYKEVNNNIKRCGKKAKKKSG